MLTSRLVAPIGATLVSGCSSQAHSMHGSRIASGKNSSSSAIRRPPRFGVPSVGPLIAVASLTCSVGNVPLAAVLWNGGISFGGVASFIFGDLIILPILNIYRKYYGARMTVLLAATFYLSMVSAALVVEALFQSLGWIPHERRTDFVETVITFNYTSVLDIIFGAVFIVLTLVFFRTGGPEMMRMMESGEHEHVPSRHPDHSA